MLGSAGVLFIDDIPGSGLGELTRGDWQTGVSEDHAAQLVWQEDDLVFTLRLGEAVDPEREEIGADDRTFRLWTTSLLALVARAAGLSGPERVGGGNLLKLRRQAGGAPGEPG